MVIKKKQNKNREWKYCLISLSSNIGATRKHISKKVRKKYKFRSLIIINPGQAQGIIKTTAIRLSPENTILFVPENELVIVGYIYSEKIISQTKTIFKKELKKDGIPWVQIQKRKNS